MAHVLGYSDADFWDMQPRKLTALIDEWKDIELARIRGPGQMAEEF